MNKAILMLAAVFGLGVVAQAQDASPSPTASMSPKASSTKHHTKHHHAKKSSKTQTE